MRLSLVLCFCFALPATSGCKDEETPGGAFAEDGIWSLQRHALDGGVSTNLIPGRADEFLLRFDASKKVMAAASCTPNDGTVHDGVGEGGCSLNPAIAEWACRCFAYTFLGTEMVFEEFGQGENPPIVSDPDETDSAGQAASLQIYAALVSGSQNIELQPLPAGVFESDGDLSSYVLQQRASVVWNTPKYGELYCSNYCGLGEAK